MREPEKAIDMNRVDGLLPVAALATPLAAQEAGEAPVSAERFEDIVTALRENSMSSEEVRRAENVAGVQIVDLAPSLDGARQQKLQNVLRNTEDGRAETRAAIEANERFEAAFGKGDTDVERVVAVTRDEDNDITIFIRGAGAD